ncbi:MAG: VanZ family protein [Spirochaetales bacterium]|nr:VanZ family protein [Spirochaetales bacterium]
MRKSCGTASEIVLWLMLTMFIVWVSVIPPSRGVPSGLSSDKLAHGLAYVGLAFFSSLVFNRFFTGRNHYVLFMLLSVLLYVLFIGVGVELLQPRFGRSLELLDAAADIAGGGLGMLIFFLVKRVYDRIIR